MTQKESHAGSSKHCHKLDPSSRQCTSPCSVLCSAVFDIQRHYGDATASLPDLAPCDFFLFQKTKSAVKGNHFESTEDTQRSVTQALNDIPQTAFQECYKQWQRRWKRCVHAQGMCFESDLILIDEKIK